MLMSRIAIYKYEVANRAYGYELCIKKILSLKESSRNSSPFIQQILRSCEFVIENEQWELTFLAWRIIASTIFKTIYKSPEKGKGFLGSYFDSEMYKVNEDIKDFWFSINSQVKVSRFGAIYSAGGYLVFIIRMLLAMQALSLTLLIIAMYRSFFRNYDTPTSIVINAAKKTGLRAWVNNLISQYGSIVNGLRDVDTLLILFVVFILIVILMYIRYRRVRRRRQILESGFLSIRTVSLVWGVILRAHYVSWHHALDISGNELKGFELENNYEKNLWRCADLIANQPNPKEWDFDLLFSDDRAWAAM
jgi:hypothetical protein